MIYESKCVAGATGIPFPQHRNERHYMVRFHDGVLPAELRHWQDTVTAMLGGAQPEIAYLMVDQGTVAPQRPHRRPGLHVDGYWLEAPRAHGGGGGGRHSGGGGHTSIIPTVTPGRHSGGGGHGGNAHSSGVYPAVSWSPDATFETPEAILLASDVPACRALVGTFEGPIREGGDCQHVDTSAMQELLLDSHRCYAGNVTFLHESLPYHRSMKRSLVRLNVPGMVV